MPSIIISYRRQDSDAIAGRIRDKLVSHYGDDSVFMDIDSIPFGLDFREHVKTALEKNDILVAVIGPGWLGSGGTNRIRIHEETDPVRIEVQTALMRGIPVVPVLVGGAEMPSPADLPEGLRDLSFRNAAPVDAGRDFHQHMERLIRSMDRILALKVGDGSTFADVARATAALDRGIPGPAAAAPIAIASAAVPSPAVVLPAVPPGAAGARGLNGILTSYGIRFADAAIERAFIDDYRKRSYTLGQTAIAIAIAGWLLFGSVAIAASKGSDLVAIRFYYGAAPALLILFFASFTSLARKFWQHYYVLCAIVFTVMAYISAHVLQDETWFRPEYVTLTFMAGIALIGMAPFLFIWAVTTQLMMAASALGFIAFDLHMAEFPTLYVIFTSIFVSVMLVIGAGFSITRERVLRREFALRHEINKPSQT